MDIEINNEIFRNDISIYEKQNEILKLKIHNDTSDEIYRKINEMIWHMDIEINLNKIKILKLKIIDN
jgi:hypothetical protein